METTVFAIVCDLRFAIRDCLRSYGNQPIEHGSIFCDRLRPSAITIARSQTIAELYAICDPRSAIVCDHMETSLKRCSIKLKDEEAKIKLTGSRLEEEVKLAEIEVP